MSEVFDLKCDASKLCEFRGKLRSLLEAGGWEANDIQQIVLAIDEALTNVMRHAYGDEGGPIRLEVCDDSDKTEFFIEDKGPSFDPTVLPEPKLPKEDPGGLGVHFIRAIMDQFSYDKEFQPGNRIHLIKYKKRRKEGST